MNRTNRKPAFRRFLQFRLRTALFAMALCGVATGMTVRFVLSLQAQRQAANSLTDKGVTLQWRLAKPVWFTRMLGVFLDEQLLSECVAVDAEHCGLKDDDLAVLTQLRSP